MSAVREFKSSLFQALANPTRLEILESLRDGELPVNAILARVERDQANISQHLAALRLRGLVVNRKKGNRVFYAVRDPLLFRVIDLMRRYAAAHVHDHIAILKRYRSEDSRAARRSPRSPSRRRRAGRRV
jgi:DNA-binding transcriptional ArsR family regulator